MDLTKAKEFLEKKGGVYPLSLASLLEEYRIWRTKSRYSANDVKEYISSHGLDQPGWSTEIHARKMYLGAYMFVVLGMSVSDIGSVLGRDRSSVIRMLIKFSQVWNRKSQIQYRMDVEIKFPMDVKSVAGKIKTKYSHS